ncbi:septal ring lytic transglycosylase RlpA family protein [Acidiferrobacter sp.]|uniref:septal ring lytic transglycosylase RlpA family protein n=1 Tax=Acidiferrobacter sp. TaxID=1872107 RepID=UPI0026173490|nr:septal ring lytic transglycosylase RlpA family protein [Acidiferrobacter sp.]
MGSRFGIGGRRLATGLCLALMLAGCGFLPSTGYRNPADLSDRNIVPHKLALSPYGNSPYTVDGRTYTPLKTAAGYRQRGIASWYGIPFNGQKTADGSTYNMYAMTAASKVLPLPSYALVRNLNNNKSVIVLINDRGPFYPGRIIDLSYAAAARLGVLATGTAPVEVEGIVPGETSRRLIRVGRHTPDVFGPHPAHPAPRPRAPHAAFFVQVGAFARHRDARRLVRRLEKRGLSDPYIVRRIINGRRLYLVRIGPEPDRGMALALSGRLYRDGLGHGLIIDP